MQEVEGYLQVRNGLLFLVYHAMMGNRFRRAIAWHNRGSGTTGS